MHIPLKACRRPSGRRWKQKTRVAPHAGGVDQNYHGETGGIRSGVRRMTARDAGCRYYVERFAGEALKPVPKPKDHIGLSNCGPDMAETAAQAAVASSDQFEERNRRTVSLLRRLRRKGGHRRRPRAGIYNHPCRHE